MSFIIPTTRSWFEDPIGYLVNIYSLGISVFMSDYFWSYLWTWKLLGKEKPSTHIIVNQLWNLLWLFRILIFPITKRFSLEMAMLHGSPWSELFLSSDWYNSTGFSACKSDHIDFFPSSSPPLKENTSISFLWLCNSETSRAISLKLAHVLILSERKIREDLKGRCLVVFFLVGVLFTL